MNTIFECCPSRSMLADEIARVTSGCCDIRISSNDVLKNKEEKTTEMKSTKNIVNYVE